MANVTQAEIDAYLANKPAKMPGESNTDYNLRITEWYKNQPHNELTPEQLAAKATLKWVRTGAAGAGQYKVVYPIGVKFDPVTGQPIGTTSTGNTNSKVSGTGDTSSDPFLFEGKPYTGKLGFFTYKDGVKVANADGSPLNSTPGATTTNTANQAARQSAYNTLYNEFNKYGLGSLVSDIKNYLIDNTFDPSEFSIQLQNTEAYKKRFAANEDRLKKGLTALTPAQYINLEDQYQEIMRRYGLPASYYTKGDLGIQQGFNKLIANDVSATELEDRVMTAQNRLINTDVNTLNALRQFYPNITSGDLLAYTLDPDNAINDIKRKAAATEIGGAALGAGLLTDVNTAETLAKYGITKAQAQQGYQTIGEFLPTATALADIYKAQGLGPYTQATAESEVFGTTGSADAARKRKKLAELEKSTFSGQSGLSGNALSRDRAGAYQGFVSPGAGSF